MKLAEDTATLIYERSFQIHLINIQYYNVVKDDTFRIVLVYKERYT